MGASDFNSRSTDQYGAFKNIRVEAPCEMLKGDNGDILPLKVFDCVYFVKDNRPYIGKLDPSAVKYVFVGYSSTQKGYIYWNSVEKIFL
jgi:hypothetical protein